MKKTIFGIIMILSLLMVIIAGCGDNNHPINLGPTPTPSPSATPTPSPTPVQWPAWTSDFTDSGMTALSVPSTPAGAFDKIYTMSDGTNLKIRVTFQTVGVGQNFWLLIDDVAQTSDYVISRWDSGFTIGWGSMGMTFNDFDLNLVYLRGRSWGPENGQWVNQSWAKIAHAVTGSSENNGWTNKSSDCSDVQTVGFTDYSSYDITIPYAAIGSGAASGAHLKIVALLGRETWQGATEGTFIGADPLGIQAVIPGDGTTVKNDDGHPRIADIEEYVKCTLK